MLPFEMDIFRYAVDIIIAVVIGVTTGILAYFRDRRRRIQQYTTDLVANILTNPILIDAGYVAYDLASAGIPLDSPKVTADQRRSVEKILDYFEFLAVCHSQGIVDIKTLVRQEGRSIIIIYEAAKSWIYARRSEYGSTSMYAELE